MNAAALEVPTFTYGTYRSLDGEEITFTDALMQQLVKNTNYAIAVKALTPPVGYDTINEDGSYAHRGTDAHAHVTAAKFRNGVISLELSKPSEQFRTDVKEGRRLRVSGEFNPKFSYTDANGKKVEVGPTIVGLAALGRHRPALKNPSIVPLSDLNFGESIAAADAFATREELRKSGFVEHHLADGKYAFSEINVDPRVFGEQEQGMTDEQIQAAIAAQVSPLKTQITNLETENKSLKDKATKLEGDVVKFSETAKRESAALSFCEKFFADRKAAGAPLPQLLQEEAKAILCDASFSEPQVERVKKLLTLMPGAFVGKGKNEGENKNGEGEETDEPEPLAKLRLKHFANIGANEELVFAGVQSFAEKYPEKVKGVEGNIDAIRERAKEHVRKRDLGDA